MNNTINGIEMSMAIERAKMFLIETCPLDELPDDNFKNLVMGYRNGYITMIQVLTEFQKSNHVFENMLNMNCMMNNLANNYY